MNMSSLPLLLPIRNRPNLPSPCMDGARGPRQVPLLGSSAQLSREAPRRMGEWQNLFGTDRYIRHPRIALHCRGMMGITATTVPCRTAPNHSIHPSILCGQSNQSCRSVSHGQIAPPP
ncbi:unnamed protein product [Periconia digitata]|uniref:Uncharacterized protein n=1 Tax=Periconia digitata TaxID=1303443 RepID=A0A9W4UTQ6_9PLEO|nr:unnamed protein product [Periconia digitata]